MLKIQEKVFQDWKLVWSFYLQEPVPIEVCLELAMPSKANGINLSPKDNQKWRQHSHYWKLYGLTL